MKLYNTLSRKKEEFKPIEEGKVKMYVCGPTVYNFIHIGNARPFIIFDTLRRYLEYRGYDVTFVQNFTDVDDKIIKRSHEENITPEEVATKYIKEYFVDADGLGIKRASVHPQVTDNIEQIIAFVKELEDKGYAMQCDSRIVPASDDDWGMEYLDYIISVKTVDSVDEAIEHINTYNTGHSESIITKDYNNANRFLDEIDAACVYVNASTRFSDGFEFGFGAEIGISTQKLHARGPMGLKALTTTKYVIYGEGQIRQ